jgi:lysophospholipase L1-like esterase
METFASRIAAKFPDHRFINLGVPGTALPQQLAILRKRHDDLNAKVYIFFFFLGNDFADILQLYDGGAKRGANTLLQGVNDHVCHHPWLEHSYAMGIVCNALPVTLSATRPWFELPHDPVFYVMDRELTDYQALAAEAVADQLHALARLQAGMNFKALIVGIPDVHQVSETSRKERADQYGIPLARLDRLRPNAILESEARRAGVPFWDSTACIAASAGEPNMLYYRQDNHFRSRGHEVFANCVMPQIAKLLSNDEPQ